VGQKRNAQKILFRKSEGNKALGRHRMGLREVKWEVAD
jgi:hypothetical protein